MAAFTRAAAERGIAVHTVADVRGAAEIVDRLVAGIGARVVRLAARAGAAELNFAEALAARGMFLVDGTTQMSAAVQHELEVAGCELVDAAWGVADAAQVVGQLLEGGVRPRLRVALLPVDRIVWTGDELGQITAAPDRFGAFDVDHVLLLDNGRSHMAADAGFAAVARCIDCGACSDVCRPLRVAGGHLDTGLPATPIALLQRPWQAGLDAAVDAEAACLLCGDCATVCPVEIPIPSLIIELRERRAGQPPRSSPLVAHVRAITHRPRPGAGERGAPSFAEQLQRSGAVQPASTPFRATLSRREREGAVLAARAPTSARTAAVANRVALVPGCAADELAPEVATSAVRLLQAAGCEVVVPPAQRCCGLPAILRGKHAAAQQAARQTIDALAGARVDCLVFLSPACAVAVRAHYPRLLAGDAAVSRRLAQIAGRVTTVTEALHEAGLASEVGEAVQDRAAALHPLCVVRPAAASAGQPDVEPAPLLTDCCGIDFAGLAKPALGAALARDLLDESRSAGASLLLA
ncbi:MAG TPA: (Fe-S)-binding protein, partial [Dehalococcoidia bacterium]|nr:(Fe-S)-binding protein [Dehalococcoidia bacterium]